MLDTEIEITGYHSSFLLTQTITTRSLSKKGFKPLTTRIVYKISHLSEDKYEIPFLRAKTREMD
ncbi:MAG: hypothetical protein VSS75_003865 [Candidatus Parabeggiatoa sp.]